MKKLRTIFFTLALRFLAKQVNGSGASHKLTPEYLFMNGWVPFYDTQTEKTFIVEPHVKDRDKIWVEFEHHYYRVWHGPAKTFIALKASLVWFQLYLLLNNRGGYGQN